MTESKFTSRKFIVWIVATVIMIACCVISFITKDTSIVTSFTSIWGGISMFYIGGNVVQDFANKGNDV